MTINSVVSSPLSVQEPITPTKDSTAKATAVAKAPEDSVNLSAAAQAKLLKHQGQSVAQIASNLALTTKAVDDYLGITESSSTLALTALVQVAHR